MIEAALGYRALGFRPIPVIAGTKKARVKWKEYQERMPTEVEIRGWWTKRPEDNVAILTGSYIGVMVVDVDGEVGRASLRELVGDMPRTPTSLTGGGGRHYLLRHPEVEVRNYVAVLPDVDVRTDGGYIVAWPSLHPDTRRPYEWDHAEGCGLDVPLAEAPVALVELLRARTASRVADAPSQVGSIPEGQRNDALTKLAGRHLAHGWSPDATLEALRGVNNTRCDPPLPDHEVKQIVQSIAGRDATRPQQRGRNRLKGAMQSGRAVIQRLDEVPIEAIEWLWPGYIALGKLTVLQGDPGLGKSSLTLDLAARVTAASPMPDGRQGTSGGVVLLTAEDGVGDTIRPRLEAMGADIRRVVPLQKIKLEDGTTRPPSLPEDMEALREAINAVDARLVVVDPFVAFLSGGVNGWVDQEVRRALHPLADLAAETGVAIVLITHLNKKQGVATIYRGGGSIGTIAAARAGFQVAKDPNDDNQRVLVAVKFNIGPTPGSRAFHLEQAHNGAARVVWDGPSALTESDLVEGRQSSKLGDAVEFLEAALAAGERPVEELKAAAFQAGISERTFERARATLNLKPYRKGFGSGGKFFLSLPEQLVTKKESLADNVVLHPLPSLGAHLGQAPGLTGPLPATVADGGALPQAEDDWEERAAIAEFDGLLPRAVAEHAAGHRLNDRAEQASSIPEPLSLEDVA
jgi:hypothetical protein